MRMNYEKLPKTISAEELLSTPLPPVKWIIPDLLPAGLALFAGPSKAGKSWLTLWLCLQVAQGKPMWGREIEPHTVLYSRWRIPSAQTGRRRPVPADCRLQRSDGGIGHQLGHAAQAYEPNRQHFGDRARYGQQNTSSARRKLRLDS